MDYYINERKCEVGDKAYLYNHADNELTEMEIVHIISRMEDMEHYDELLKNDDDVLLDGEDEYKADTICYSTVRDTEFFSDSGSIRHLATVSQQAYTEHRE